VPATGHCTKLAATNLGKMIRVGIMMQDTELYIGGIKKMIVDKL